MPEIGMSASMSGDGKRSVGHRPQATAPILDSTVAGTTVGRRGGRFLGATCRSALPGSPAIGARELWRPVLKVLRPRGDLGRSAVDDPQPTSGMKPMGLPRARTCPSFRNTYCRLTCMTTMRLLRVARQPPICQEGGANMPEQIKMTHGELAELIAKDVRRHGGRVGGHGPEPAFATELASRVVYLR